MYINTLPLAALAILSTTASSAPTPPHFPGISFHGVPHTNPHPGTWDYNITSTNDTIIAPHHPHNHHGNDDEDTGHHNNHGALYEDKVHELERRNVDVKQVVDFDRFNFTEMERLIGLVGSIGGLEERAEGEGEEVEGEVVVGRPVSFPLGGFGG